jgi:hypothetical protein
VVVFASGYLGDDPSFGLYLCRSNGSVLPLSFNNHVATETTTIGNLKALYR